MDIAPGARLGRYEIVAAIGAGGMGEVFRARDARLGREVAIKVLPRRLAADADALERFEREARAVAALAHPNILAIYDFGEQDGRWFAVMELLEGQTLGARLRQGPVPLPTVLACGIQIARGLTAAHARGIIHRDLKPENLFLLTDGTLKILDFGIASIEPVPATGEAETRAGLTREGAVVGTTEYMAPEQIRGERSDQRTDVFALGVVLYELLTGRRPFRGDSMADLATAILRDPPSPLAATSDVPHRLSAVVERCLEKSPAARYQTARELTAALEAIAADPKSASDEPRAVLRRAPGETGRSIAVLPFADMSADRSLDYFCEGIAEEIITALMHVGDLRVVARSSSFQFKGQAADVRRIGEQLRVGTVLDGSVRSAGQRLRVVTQLVNTHDGHQIWSERFDRQLDDIFAVQDEIARAVVTALRMQVGGSTVARMAQGTTDPDAYTLYLKGRHHWNRRTAADLRRSISYYRDAIARDPAFGQAHAGLAEAYVTQGLYGLIRPAEVMPNARAAAEAAAAFPAAQASAAAVLGCVSGIYEWNWREARRHFAEATGGNLGAPSGRQWYAINYLVPLGQFQDAEDELARARDADPLSLPISLSFGLTRYFAHRFDDAIAALQATLDLDPGFVTARMFLALALAEAGHTGKARSTLATDTGGVRQAEVVAAEGYVCAIEDDREGADRALRALADLAAERYVSPSLEAQVHAGLGDLPAALDALERAADLRAADLAWLAVRPVFRRLHDEPRFARLIMRIGLAGPA